MVLFVGSKKLILLHYLYYNLFQNNYFKFRIKFFQLYQLKIFLFKISIGDFFKKINNCLRSIFLVLSVIYHLLFKFFDLYNNYNY